MLPVHSAAARFVREKENAVELRRDRPDCKDGRRRLRSQPPAAITGRSTAPVTAASS